MRRRLLGLALVSGGLLLGFAQASGRITHPLALLLALLLFLIGALLSPSTHQIAESIRPLVGLCVHARAWGAELPGHAGTAFRIHAVRAIGAGLHFYLVPPEGKPIHLKIAQPRDVIIGNRSVEVCHAKYVQWAGKTIAKVSAEKPLVLMGTE